MMDIEQRLPTKPNFTLILGLACATIVTLFVLALLFLKLDSGHLVFRHSTPHPTSQLLTPLPNSPSLTA